MSSHDATRVRHRLALALALATGGQVAIARADSGIDAPHPPPAVPRGLAKPDPSIELAALVPGSDVLHAVVVGDHGEVYEPDGRGAWTRRRAGGLASTVVAANRAGDGVVALTADGQLFRLGADEWSTVVVGSPHAKATLGAGSRVLAASGRTVAVLAPHAGAAKLAEAPAPVLALAASTRGAVVETERGLARDEHGTWKAIPGSPHHVAALLSDRFALADDERGLVDVDEPRLTAWPSGERARVVVAVDNDMVIAVATHDADVELLSYRAGSFAHERVTIDSPGVPVAVVTDHAGRVAVALRDGRIALRDHGTWTTVHVRDDLPAAHPGPPPAPSA